MKNTAHLVLALDQGTTSSRALVFDKQGQVQGSEQVSFKQYYPQPGWVEHDALEILSSQLSAITEVLVVGGIEAADIDCMGITNQRETTVLWNRETGMPIAPAIVWQCRRTAEMVEEIIADPAVRKRVRESTGLVPDAYFSASKIKWLLDNTPGARELADQDMLAFGTVDCWLIWQLTGGKVHATDYTNASRTMLFNIHEGSWDPWLLDLFDVPTSLLPEVKPSAAHYGYTAHPSLPSGIPICGVAGDQQAALFGQGCFKPGEAKNTYGTGSFLLVHNGSEATHSKHHLITTIAASAPETKHLEYAIEGSVYVSGALVQWLRDELKLIKTAAETEHLARKVKDAAGVYIVPAFTGLGAPYWDMDARGAILGLTRGTNKTHIARAALEAMAYQLSDLIEAASADTGHALECLKVDGGASANDFLLQFQSDILDIDVMRPANTESTALGAAFLAGLHSGFWQSTDELLALLNEQKGTVFTPQMGGEERDGLLKGWKNAVSCVLTERGSFGSTLA